MQLESNHSSVCAIVVNWNRPEDTLACIHSLIAQKNINLHIVVIDNGSTDDSVHVIRNHFPEISMISSPINLKFGKGTNLGIRYALEQNFEYVFLLNNDATLASDCIQILLNYMAPGIGVTAPLIYYTSHPNRIWSIGGKTQRWTLEQSNDYANQSDPGNLPIVIEQDFVTGCCMLISQETLNSVGLFDETFEFYYEDADLCLRIRQAELKILVITRAKAWHKVSMSSGGSGSPNQRYWLARSSIYFFRKHAKWWQIPSILIWRFAHRAPYYLLSRRKK